jgi:DHA1 family tetracycline resistance protein-like MFS transporter
VPATEQGKPQGATSSVTSLASVFAMMPTLFAFSGPSAPVHFPGAAFFAAALCEPGGLALYALAQRRRN